jgi:membrane-bound lytic murein transglycosylase B
MRRASPFAAAILALTLVAAPLAASAQNVNALFRDWLVNDLWPQARANGVSADTFNAAFDGVTPNLKLPDLVMPGELNSA